MARQRVGEKKLRYYKNLTGLDLVAATVRGGTDHRVDLCLRNGEVRHLLRTGEMENWGWKHAGVKEKQPTNSEGEVGIKT